MAVDWPGWEGGRHQPPARLWCVLGVSPGTVILLGHLLALLTSRFLLRVCKAHTQETCSHTCVCGAEIHSCLCVASLGAAWASGRGA